MKWEKQNIINHSTINLINLNNNNKNENKNENKNKNKNINNYHKEFKLNIQCNNDKTISYHVSKNAKIIHIKRLMKHYGLCSAVEHIKLKNGDIELNDEVFNLFILFSVCWKIGIN